MKTLINKRIKESIAVKEKVLTNDIITKQIQELCAKIIEALKNGNKVIFAGNGGSCADAFHLAGEFVSRFLFDRPAIPSIALWGNIAVFEMQE